MNRKRTIDFIAFSAVIITLAAFFIAGAFKKPPYAEYNDGVYIGEAKGYRKHLKAEVTLEKGYITNIQIIEHYEKGKEHYEAPISLLPPAIIKAQSPDVDAISGSTLTSNGIMDAVHDALEQAKKRL
ncbi:MAG: FMN-binding domain protein [Firmicutes bacterium ADurb.Bin182]|nr:MAG: FMN-binding domain protein [Firmicutes bacterium ADurb.Bin182]